MGNLSLVAFLLLVSPSLQWPYTNWWGNPQQDPKFWHNQAIREIGQVLKLTPNTRVAKNIVLIIGDGMSTSTLTSARIHKGQQMKSMWGGEEVKLEFERFPNVGLIKTYSVDMQVSDSASTATAILSGSKTQYRVIGMAGSVKKNDATSCMRDDLKVSSIGQWAIDAGKDVGFVTNTRITHATPAGLYAHTPTRQWEGHAPLGCKDIATQLIEDQPGRSLKVMMGGGKDNFIRNGLKTKQVIDRENEERDEEDRYSPRGDTKNLVDEWMEQKERIGAKAKVAFDLRDLEEVDAEDTDYLMGLFANDHMPYEDERPRHTTPHLADMSKKAIEILRKSNNGFFLLVEGGKIDIAHHQNYGVRALNEVLALDKTLETILEMVNLDETLIIVTADHSHSMQMVGYQKIGTPMGGLTVPDYADGKPSTSLVYANGPGILDHYTAERHGWQCKIIRKDLRWINTISPTFRQISAVNRKTSTHGGDDVAVYAIGPMAHLFRTLHDQTYIAHVMAYSMCVGPHYGNQRCKVRY